MSNETRIEALLGAPPDSWAAFQDDQTTLIAYGESYEDAVSKASEKGFEDPVIVKIPKDWTETVL